MLHLNDYSLEKTFVYGIMALSKWLGQTRFPYGVYGSWPPTLPACYIPASSMSMPVAIVQPPPLPPPGYAPPDDAPPRDLKRAASSSSTALHLKKK